MASTFLPVVFNNLPPIIRSHHLWTIIWGFSIVIFYSNLLLNRLMGYVLLYGLFLFLLLKTIWSNIDEGNYYGLLKEFYEIAIGVSVISYFCYRRDYIGLAKITKWAIIFLFITAIMSIISSAIDPMYVRNIGQLEFITDESERESILFFKYYGGGNYSTASAFMCIFPIFIYYYKNIKTSPISKTQIILFLSIIFFALIGMQIFGNILIAIIFSIISLLGMKKMKQTILVICLFLSLAMILPKQEYVRGMISISDYFEKNAELNFKIKDLATFVQTGANINNNTAAGLRAERYPILMESFLKSPLLGCFFLSDKTGLKYKGEGAHLYWMNKLTITGIIGLIFFLFIPYKFIRNNLKQFDSTYRFYYILASLSILCYGLIKVVGGRETWYTFLIILPGLYYLPLLKKSNKI